MLYTTLKSCNQLVVLSFMAGHPDSQLSVINVHTGVYRTVDRAITDGKEQGKERIGQTVAEQPSVSFQYDSANRFCISIENDNSRTTQS